MKTKSLAAILLALVALTTVAQERDFIRIYLNRSEQAALFSERIARDMSQRTDKRQVLSNHKYLLDGVERCWTNGFNLFGTCYDHDCREIGLYPRTSPESWDDPIGLLRWHGGRITTSNDNGTRYSVEQLGGYVMLVGRDKLGKPNSAYYLVSDEESNHGKWAIVGQMLLAGRYVTDDGKSMVVGLRLPHYEGERYDCDPGIFDGFWPTGDYQALNILYADQRVSRGNPNAESYKANQPGGGGAGALMPPMHWSLQPTIEGLRVRVLRDEPYVDHNPRVQDKAVLTLVQNPYQGLDGKWAIASVMPLTHQLLRLFPKPVLRLMRGEIYARYGDTFSDPDTQRYFDTQPWYKKRPGHITLTDIERFNYALIQSVENGK